MSASSWPSISNCSASTGPDGSASFGAAADDPARSAQLPGLGLQIDAAPIGARG
jgi:hypothetical protein